MSGSRRWWMIPALGSLAAATAGCGGAEGELEASDAAPQPIVVSIAPAVAEPVERAVEVVGTLHGWEEVTIAAEQSGRVVAVRHDVGDRVAPGEVLVSLDTVQANLAVQQARAKLLGELTRLDITEEQGRAFVERYGVTEQLLSNTEVRERIDAVPAVQRTQASLEQAEQQLDRQRQLARSSAGVRQEFEDAENAVRLAEAAHDDAVVTARTVIASAIASKIALDQATETLEEMTVRAPTPSETPPGYQAADGVRYAISTRQVAEGQFLRVGDPVFDLVLEHPLRLRAGVPEKYVGAIAVGQQVNLTVAAYPGETFVGEVVRINPAVDPVSRTFRIEAEVPNPENRLRPGGFAKARIITRRDDDATLVPIESVVRFAGVVKLFRYEPDPAAGEGRGIAREEEVETGQEREGLVEILGGLPDGSMVVTSGQTRLAEGSPIILRSAKDEADAAPEAADAPVEE